MSNGFNSFYGGRRGASFVIVKRYISIKEMVECFQQGGDYKTVNYDEYVLIDTVSKNDADNGKIYRRGYEYTNELGGAIYVGQIVGPAGMAPHLELKTIKEVKELSEQDDFEYRRGEGSYAPTENLVPGKYTDEEGMNRFNDEISWAYCSVRDENAHETTAYIGFKIPYSVIEFTAKSVNPYYNRSKDGAGFINEDLIDRTDDTTHPFFEEWSIAVPKGIKGDTFKNFRMMVADASIQDYDGRADDIRERRKVLVYDYYQYDDKEDSKPTSIYIGDYNMIDDVELNDDGTITITYTHDDKTVYNKKLKWLKSLSLDPETGHLIVEYNQETDAEGQQTKYETDLTWIKDINIDEEGTITFNYTNQDDKVLEKELKYVKEVTLDSKTGHFTMTFNQEFDKNGEPTIYETDLDWVTGIDIAENGTITIHHVNGNDETAAAAIQYITDVTLDTDGTLTVTYNTGETDKFDKIISWIDSITLSDDGIFTIKYNNGKEDFTKILKWLSAVNINIGDTEGEGNQKVHVIYNTREEADIGNPLNYIMKTAIEAGHLLCLYSDPAKREEIKAQNKNYTYDGRDDWYDLGMIISNTGLLAGKYYDKVKYPELDTIEHTIAYLNQKYPNGLTEEDLIGKMVTVGSNEDNKEMYAFDYTKTGETYGGWYYLGKLAMEIAPSVVAREDDPNIQSLLNDLPVNGIWFIEEE